jgi:hypothetical protein
MGFRVKLHSSNFEPLMSALGQKQTLGEGATDVRFTPKSGHHISRCAGAWWSPSVEGYGHAPSREGPGIVWAFALEQGKAKWSKSSATAKGRLVDPQQVTIGRKNS